MDAKAKVVDVLRERYAPTEVPPCRVCGGPLSIAGIGGGKPTVWACSGNEDDPDRPGFIRSQPGRWGNAKEGVSEYGPGGHYHDSRWEDRRQGGDSQVIELIEAHQSLLTDHEAALAELKDQALADVTGKLKAELAQRKAERQLHRLLTGLEALAGVVDVIRLNSDYADAYMVNENIPAEARLRRARQVDQAIEKIEKLLTLTNSAKGG